MAIQNKLLELQDGTNGDFFLVLTNPHVDYTELFLIIQLYPLINGIRILFLFAGEIRSPYT